MSTILNLKANSRGSWANVCEFEPRQLKPVLDGAELLARASGETVSFRVADSAGVILYSLDARRGAFAWKKHPV